jgi:hypothetical protein
VVVGVTNEEPSLVQRTAVGNRMEFAIARVEGDAVDRAFGVSSFPTAFLIDRQGRIGWEGHPGRLSAATIRGLLAE